MSKRPKPASSLVRGLGAFHGLLALAALVVGLPLALIGVMALLGAIDVVATPTWVKLSVALLAVFGLPLLVADRLLPEDPRRRKPGLVRDVLAGSWMAVSLVFVTLAGTLTGVPLRAEAARLEEQGWTRAAWLGRWMAGPEQQTVASEVELEPEVEHETSPEAPAEPEAQPAELTASVEQVEQRDEKPEEPAKPEAPEANAKAVPESTREFTPAQLFAAFAPAVVSITTDRGSGTGFFVDREGTIATNHHVIAHTETIEVGLFDGTTIGRVELLTSNEEVDLALLRIDAEALDEPLVSTVLGDSEGVEVGEPAIVIGNPLGLEHTLTDGIVSSRRIYEGERYIQMSAPISPGNSGGPVFDRHGEVIGVSVAQMWGGQNLNLAVPISQLQALIASDYPERRSFGASSW
jgi:S1-C subfamily serine protease